MKRFLSILITMLAIGAIVSPNINANDGTRKKVEDICGQFPE